MMFSFIIDGQGGSYIAQLSFQFACYFVGICLLYPVAIWYIPDTNYFQEENVIVPHHVEEELKGAGHVEGAQAGEGASGTVEEVATSEIAPNKV